MDIGGADIPAARLPDIHAHNLAEQQAEGNRADEVGTEQQSDGRQGIRIPRRHPG